MESNVKESQLWVEPKELLSICRDIGANVIDVVHWCGLSSRRRTSLHMLGLKNMWFSHAGGKTYQSSRIQTHVKCTTILWIPRTFRSISYFIILWLAHQNSRSLYIGEFFMKQHEQYEFTCCGRHRLQISPFLSLSHFFPTSFCCFCSSAPGLKPKTVCASAAKALFPEIRDEQNEDQLIITWGIQLLLIHISILHHWLNGSASVTWICNVVTRDRCRRQAMPLWEVIEWPEQFR